MTQKIRLTDRMPEYFRLAAIESGRRYYVMKSVLEGMGVDCIPEDFVWYMLEENSKDSDSINFSENPTGNEGQLGYMLLGLPPEFSSRLLETYEKNGFITREDVKSAFVARKES